MVTCKEYVALKKEAIRKMVSRLERTPCLVVLQIGDDIASNSYIKGKRRDCEEVGVELIHYHIDDYNNYSQEALEKIIYQLDNNSKVDGIIIQLPIPNKYDVDRLQKCISPVKDVDGFRKDSYFEPCTPSGIVQYLTFNKIDFVGKECVIIGRSKIVGKPLVDMLIEKGATVISCNSKTKDVSKFTRDADIVVSAIGEPNYFDSSYFRYHQILVDVGINKDKSGKLCGDICREVGENAKMLTPVPNGVGLLTRLQLIENVINAYRWKEEICNTK